MSFNPRDNTCLCVVGEGIYKQFRYTEGTLKQHSFQKSDPLNYLSHAWLSESRLLLGSDCGRVQLYEGGELKNEFEVMAGLSPEGLQSPSHASRRESSTFGRRESYAGRRESTGGRRGSAGVRRESAGFRQESFGARYDYHIEESLTRVACILTYSKGFICSGGSGVLHLFEKTDEKNVFKWVRSVSVRVDPSSQLDIPSERDNLSQEILNMTLSPSEENVVCTTQSQQLYSLTLSAADLGKARHCAVVYVCAVHTYVRTYMYLATYIL